MNVVQLDKLLFDCLNQVLALIVICNIGDYSTSLHRELGGNHFQALLISAYKDHDSPLVQIPIAQSSTYTRGCSSDDNTLSHEIVGGGWQVLLASGVAHTLALRGELAHGSLIHLATSLHLLSRHLAHGSLWHLIHSSHLPGTTLGAVLTVKILI